MLVEGDTNSVLAGALAAHQLGIKIGHIEAGLRSYSKLIEEMNRILTGLYADYHFAPTENARDNLLKPEVLEKLIEYKARFPRFVFPVFYPAFAVC